MIASKGHQLGLLVDLLIHLFICLLAYLSHPGSNYSGNSSGCWAGDLMVS